MDVYLGRHPAALAWARSHGLPTDARIIAGDAVASDLVGCHVWGVVPYSLAIYAAQIHVVEFLGAPPRGREYTVADMVAAGARWSTYSVAVECPVCGMGIPMRVLSDGEVSAHDCAQPPHHRAMD